MEVLTEMAEVSPLLDLCYLVGNGDRFPFASRENKSSGLFFAAMVGEQVLWP
jgi:hypothetical protein